ncbi:MAG: hypothetical protein H0U71_04930 [Gammaproteobacteria bacterium]|nr:hypothetical protein [Gammaproteobacteria bacterium]
MAFLKTSVTPQFEYMLSGIPLNPIQIREVRNLGLPKGTFIYFWNNQLIAHAETQSKCLEMARIKLKELALNPKPEDLRTVGQLGSPSEEKHILSPHKGHA